MAPAGVGSMTSFHVKLCLSPIARTSNQYSARIFIISRWYFFSTYALLIHINRNPIYRSFTPVLWFFKELAEVGCHTRKTVSYSRRVCMAVPPHLTRPLPAAYCGSKQVSVQGVNYFCTCSNGPRVISMYREFHVYKWFEDTLWRYECGKFLQPYFE